MTKFYFRLIKSCLLCSILILSCLTTQAQVTSVRTGLPGNSLTFTSPDHTGDILYFKSSTRTGSNGANSVFDVTIGRFNLTSNTEVATITLSGLESTSSFGFSLQYNDLIADANGNLYVSSNTVNMIKRFDGPLVSTGTQTISPSYTYTFGTQAPNNSFPIVMDADGNLLGFCRGVLYRVNKTDLTTNAAGSVLFSAPTASPYDIDMYVNGNILFSSSSSAISEYTLTGTLVRNITVGGNAFAIEVASNGNIYYTTGNSNTIGVWSPCTNTATVIAGVTNSSGNAVDAGTTQPYTNARFSRVVNLCLRSNGDLFAADENNSTIYKIINPAATLFNFNPVKTAPGNALQFDGVDDYAKINRSVGNSFTIEYWMRTTQTGGTGTQWTSGQSLVDADVTGVNNDFGTSLLGSKLAFGIGNPDVTIQSVTDVNTGKWVHVAVTRDFTTGAIQLYINGMLEASGSAAASTVLNASASIFLGANAANSNNYNGAIDELRVYDAVLTQANIQADMKTYAVAVPCNLVNYYYFDNGIAGATNTGITTVRDYGNNYNPASLFNFSLAGNASNFVESYAMVVPTIAAATNIGATAFTANWIAPASGTVGNYLLDVSTAADFSSFISGYNALTVTGTSSTVAVSGSGTYYYRVRADKASVTGQGGNSGAMSVTINNTVSITPGTIQPVCVGTTAASLPYSDAAFSPVTYSIVWSAAANGAGFTNVTDATLPPSPITITLPAGISGSFTGTLTVKNLTSTSGNYTISVTINPLPVVAPVTGLQQVCVGSTQVFADATASGVWSSSNTAIATVSSGGTVTGITPGTATISYTVTSAAGCATTVTRTITVNANPVVSNIAGPTTVCLSANITLTNTTVSGTWSSANTNIATVNSSGIVTGIAGGTASIRYTVANAAGCSATATTNITVSDVPSRTALVKDTIICKGTTYTVNATIAATATYKWTSAAGFSANTANITVTTPALYNLLITLSNGCTISDSVNLRNTTDTAVKAKLLVASQAFINQNVVAVNLTTTDPQTQAWSVPAGATIISQVPNQLVLKFTIAGTYQVGLRNTSYSVCSSADSGKVVVINSDSVNVANTNQVLVREVTIGPNPSTGVFNFTIKLNRTGKVSIRIYSISGTSVYTMVIPESTLTTVTQRVDISAFPKDTYIAVVQTANSNEVRTLIKN